MRKPVVGFEGLYEVDDCGNVYSLPRMRRANYGDYMKPERRLAPVEVKGGYLAVTLRKPGVQKMAKVHRIVLCAFESNPAGLPMCLHINGNPKDNRLANLKFGAAKENAADRIAHGRNIAGSKSPNALLSDEKVIDIRKRRESISEQAAKYGVSVSLIRKVRTKEVWAHI